MTDGQSQTPKNSSNGFFKDPGKWIKKTFSAPSRSSLPATGQENRGGEISSVQHVVVSSGSQLTIPVIGASATTSQQGVSYASLIEHSAQYADLRTPTQLLRSQISPPDRGPSVVQSESFESVWTLLVIRLTGAVCRSDSGWRSLNQSSSSISRYGSCLVVVACLHPTTLFKGPVGSLSGTTSSRLSDCARVAWSFTEMLLKKLPGALDSNPVKVAFSIVKIILEVKEVRQNSSHRPPSNHDVRVLKTISMRSTDGSYQRQISFVW